MRVTVKYLLWMSDKARTSREEYVFSQEEITIEQLLQEITRRHKNLEKHLANPFTSENPIIITINGRPAKPGTRIREGDQVTIMPPVSGG